MTGHDGTDSGSEKMVWEEDHQGETRLEVCQSQRLMI